MCSNTLSVTSISYLCNEKTLVPFSYSPRIGSSHFEGKDGSTHGGDAEFGIGDAAAGEAEEAARKVACPLFFSPRTLFLKFYRFLELEYNICLLLAFQWVWVNLNGASD